jgi:small subunit ribosomal protein S2
MEKNLSGIRGMRKLPGLLIVVDPSKEHLAVAEANKLGIPVMALVDTNCNPDPIQHIIACNDDALKSVKLIIQTLTQAVIEKKNEMRVAFGKGDEAEAEGEGEGEEEGEEEEAGRPHSKQEFEPARKKEEG